MKKVISLLLALVMALSLLPTAVWAEGEDAAAPAEEVSESFFDSSHPFTWNGGSYVWRFWWNGPDGSRGEWHLYAAPEGTSADSADGWTDCGAEATPFAHLTEGTLAYAAAFAMRSAWEAYKGDEKVSPDLMWLIDMMSYESVAYTNEDVKAAQEFMDSLRIGMDGGTATLVFPDGSADELLDAWYGTTPAVCAALQKVMHCELVSTGDLYNFTQLLHRTLKAADNQGGSNDGGNSFTNSCQALWDSGFQAPENPNFVFPAGLVEGEDYTYTYNNATGELHVVLLPQFDKGNHWADAFHNMSAGSNSLNLQIRMTAKDEYTRAKDFSFNGSPASVINESGHVDTANFNMDNGVRWSGGSTPLGTVNRIDGQATIAPTDAFNKHFIAVVWGDDSGTVLRKELVILTVEVQQEFVVNTFYDVAKPIPAEKLRSGFTFMSGVTGWEASFSDGKLELFPDNGIPTSGDPIELGRIRWDDMAPDGYHFKSYVRLNSGNGEETFSGVGVWTWPNANGRGVDELYEVTWYNDTDNTSILQNLAVYQYDKMPYYRYISKDGVTAAPVTSLGLDTAQLSSSGIGVTYDETTGCFHVSHSGWELPDASTLLDTRITPTPPEGAVYFSAIHDDGNRDPRIMGKSEASDILASLESFEKYSVTDSNRVNERSLELVRTQVVHLPGIDVCLSGSSNHRGLTVAWWDADKNLIGMSYVYGQNDDFMNRTRLTSVETADKLDDLNTRGEVNAPALVGAEGMELICDRYPQTGNGMTQFFDLHLIGDKGGTKTVYIPYHCFGMTYADDVQGKSADELPTILVRHFDANYNFRNEIIGRYEPQGIVFETDSFSPFTVSVGGGQSGGHSGTVLNDGEGRRIMLSAYMENGWLGCDGNWDVQGEFVGPNGNIPAFRLGTDRQGFLLALESSGTQPGLTFKKPDFCENDVLVEYLGVSVNSEYYVYRVDFMGQIDRACTVRGYIDYGNGNGSDVELRYEQRYGDNIGGYDRWGEGSAWNGDPLQYMVIKSLRNMDGRDRLELGVDWRYDKVGSIYNVGITSEVLTQIVNANKPLVIYNERELTLSPATLSDMLQKLNVLNANRGAEDNKALLWFRYEYGNWDGENGQACAFMTTVYLGGTRYRLPDGETYTFSIYFDCNDVTAYELYCPADPEDASSELVKQTTPLSCVDGHNDDGHSWRQCSFTADHDGMFVIHPKGYQMQQSWPWWGVPTPPWTPSPDATTPNSEVPELRSLYASGFKFPVIGKDIHFVFPEQLKEWTEGCGDDWDYRFTADESNGRVAIEVNMGSRDRWENAVRNIETGGLDDGVFFRYYFGNSDNQLPMTYGFDWYGDYGGQSLADNTLYRGYHHNNSLHLATVNRQNAHNSVLTLNSQGEDWRIILAMSNSEGKVAAAEAKYAFQLEILPREDISFSLPADNGTAVPAARLHPTDIHSDWTATVPADGSVFLRTVEGKTLNNAGSGQYGLLGELTVDAPEGYALREWRNNCTGGSGGQFPVPLFRDDQVITLIWQKVNAPDLVEYVRVESMNYLPGFYSLGDENAPSRAPSAAEFLSAAEQKTLSDNGITVTYDEKLGYFTTSVDASKLTDLSLLHQCVTLNALENAVYFKFTGEGGSENPASHNIDEDVKRFTEQFNNPDAELQPVDPDRPVRMPLMHTEEIKLDGKTVYYSESQSYNSLIVQWLDEGKNVIGYTCLYGRNGDISTTVDTETVDTAPTEAVSVPTLVGTDLKLLCDRNPQTEDSKRLFLLFNVTGEGQLGEDGAEIYLPYSYFDLTAEEGMALAAKGVRPLIRHYLNENCTEKESLLGEYTAAGVRIVTRSFSPFLIDANGCTVGDLNGDGAVDTLDMQALYENLSTGRTTEKLADEDDFRLLADCNGDGEVNILDYQKLYQGIKTA